MQPKIIETKRLILRPWRAEDFEPFAAINADPRVMEYFPATLTREESDAYTKRIARELEERGWGLWAVSVRDGAPFIGFIGLAPVQFTAHFTPAVEIGWRLGYEFWGKGYATEGARAALRYGFDVLNLEKIVSFTAAQNMRSRKVMEKIGMHHNPADDFDHPRLPEGHPLRRHVLYQLARHSS
ncbi:MAG: GNAT family N-acetyltransferase [Chlamydiales bacterium]